MQEFYNIGSVSVSSDFRTCLYSTRTRVCDVILGYGMKGDKINFIAVAPGKKDTITYLPANKVQNVLENQIDPFSNGIGRSYMKIGRFLSKVFSKDVIEGYMCQKDIEDFVNYFKDYFDDSKKRFLIVEGNDIKKYYLEDNYQSSHFGTLWKSCMRYEKCQKFLDLYTKNKEVVKLLVLLGEYNGVEVVKGRALLWKAIDNNGKDFLVMDRIYTIYDSDVITFKKWAVENGYITKMYQTAKHQNIFDLNGVEAYYDLKVQLKEFIFDKYPYLDSFQFFDMSKGIIYNNENRSYDYHLVQGDGSLFHEDLQDEEPMFDDDDNYIDLPWDDQ